MLHAGTDATCYPPVNEDAGRCQHILKLSVRQVALIVNGGHVQLPCRRLVLRNHVKPFTHQVPVHVLRSTKLKYRHLRYFD
eukprot:scaffold1034_cov418-Prasinococcus_capsulatus_cf.AAC.13